MLKEGAGWIAPPPVREFLDPSVRKWLKRIADERDEIKQYKQSSDQWRRGLRSNATYIGLGGEQATANYLSRQLGILVEIDQRIYQVGDPGWDFIVYGVKIDVKCLTSQELLIKRLMPNGYLIPFKADIYVKAGWDCGEAVLLAGWVNQKQIKKYGC